MVALSLSHSSLPSKDMRSPSLYDRSRASAQESGRAPYVVEEVARGKVRGQKWPVTYSSIESNELEASVK
ncbi:unnamed protein product [Prunus brigantina]